MFMVLEFGIAVTFGEGKSLAIDIVSEWEY